jgi:hypothetical protein
VLESECINNLKGLGMILGLLWLSWINMRLSII